MTTSINENQIPNFKDFKSYIQKFGFSLSNFYDVNFFLTNGTKGSLANIFNRIPGTDLANANDANNAKGLMRLYAEECTIPGYQISTGEFRITNSPTMKYGYGIVNNEITFSFIMDAGSEIRKTFDAWQAYIYTHIATNNTIPNITLNPNSVSQLGRTRYKDEYVSDIQIIKFERYASNSGLIQKNGEINNFLKGFHPTKDIIPDSTEDKSSGFGKAIPVYSVRLRNAFPTNISSMSLSSGSSQLLKLQVTFEYDLAIQSSLSGNSTTSGSWPTVV